MLVCLLPLFTLTVTFDGVKREYNSQGGCVRGQDEAMDMQSLCVATQSLNVSVYPKFIETVTVHIRIGFNAQWKNCVINITPYGGDCFTQ